MSRTRVPIAVLLVACLTAIAVLLATSAGAAPSKRFHYTHRVSVTGQLVDRWTINDPDRCGLVGAGSVTVNFRTAKAALARPYIDPASHEFVATSRAIGNALKGDAKKAWQAMKAELDAFADLHPGELAIGTGIVDAGPVAPPTHTLRLGVYDRKVEPVEPGFLTILAPGSAAKVSIDEVYQKLKNEVTAAKMVRERYAS